MNYPKRAIFNAPKKNLLFNSFQKGEELIFISKCSVPSQNAMGFAFYARPHEKWNSKIVNVKYLKEVI